MRPSRPNVGRATAALVALGLSACGYEPVHSASALGRGPYALVAASVHVADPEAALAAEAGARAELARQGALAQCEPARDDGCASIVVELLHLDETTSGIAAAAGAPQGLGVRTTARGRATVFERGRTESIDDVEASEFAATPPSSAAALVSSREAALRAARRLGERLVRRALRIPEPLAD